MNDRLVVIPFFIPGTTTANHLLYCELPFPWTLLGIKASAVNDSDATLQVSRAGSSIISATAIGDGDPTYIEPTDPAPVDADELISMTLDYDGASGTAAEQVSLIVIGLVGDG